VRWFPVMCVIVGSWWIGVIAEVSCSAKFVVTPMNLRPVLLGSLFLACYAQVQAASITLSGFAEGVPVANWRTASTSKGGLDIDGDNIFGSSLGAVHWGVAGINEHGGPALGWTFRGNSAQEAPHGDYALIDDPQIAAPNTKIHAGLGALGGPGSFTFGLEGTAGDYLGKTVRVGIMADVLGATENAADMLKTYRITGAGGADSGLVSLRGGGSGNGIPEMYFFDITGVNPGDVFTITAGNAGSPQSGYIGPVSWDIATVPEPGTAIFGVLGLGTLMARRRRASV
jgi:hypothetical protein